MAGEYPVVAIVGRPNVGKSTLFNRLVGRKLALVDDQPGVTRDRREGDARLYGMPFTVVDTAGFEEAAAATLAGRMRKQTDTALADADVILFVIDARQGVTPMDESFAALVRRFNKPVVLLANKAEAKGGRAGTYEAYSLGLGEPIAVSAEHGDGMADLHETLRGLFRKLKKKKPQAEEISQSEEDDEDQDDEVVSSRELPRDENGDIIDERPAGPLRVAIIGRPNAGKSTLVNRILGEERLLTGPEAGITRDTISLEWSHRGRDLILHDTAGLRRRARVEDKLEKLSVADALRAVRFAEVVVILLDATIPFEKQDLSIVDLVAKEGRALVIGLNKWDLVADQRGLLKVLREKGEHLLPQVRGVQIVQLSGLSGGGVDGLLDAVLKADEVWNSRVPTAGLNRWLEAAVGQHPPPAVSGRRIKIRYMTQAKTRPPSFVLFGNQLDHLPTSYLRYLTTGLRETFNLPGTPIRIMTRNSKNPYEKG
ncbi:MAG: ribosome biogenesis GTPase Der [Bosea sp. (in: a-proteobacteria)]